MARAAGLDPDAARVLDLLRLSGAKPIEALSVAEARAAYRESCRLLAAPAPPLAEIRDLACDGPAGAIPLRLYRPSAAMSAPALLYCHGGGWVIGDLDTHDALCRTIAAESGATVIAVAYRLAPEAPFPAATEDVEAAYEFVVSAAGPLGIDPRRIAVGGDSAGGSLAASLCLARRERAPPRPCFQLLLYPALDLTRSQPSHARFATQPPLTAAALTWFADHYVPCLTDRHHWRASPLLATGFVNLPPALVLVAECDPLVDEGRAYAARLVDAGGQATIRLMPGQIHGCLTMGRIVRAAQPALADVAATLRVRFTEC